MDRQLKQRVVGAGLLVAFGVIFIPIFLDNGGVESPLPPSMNIPPAPTEDVSQRAPALGEEAIAAMEARADEDAELPPPRVQAGEGRDAEPLPVVTPSASGEPPLTIDTLEEGAAAHDSAAIETPPPRMQPPPLRNAPPPAVAAASTASPSRPSPMDLQPAASQPPPNPKLEVKSQIKADSDTKPPAMPIVSTPATVAGWTVQLGSFASDVNARKLVDKLKAAGYKAYSEPRIEQRATVFKVRVGPTPSKAEAERLRQRIEAQFEARGMLVPLR